MYLCYNKGGIYQLIYDLYLYSGVSLIKYNLYIKGIININYQNKEPNVGIRKRPIEKRTKKYINNSAEPPPPLKRTLFFSLNY